MSRSLKNLMITASAGCGKTHRLVSRYLELLEAGVAPEKIIALTFTREASGEFLDSIFKRLVERARQNNEASARVFLRLLVEKLPRLSLGTLDSFFARILRAFPMECGLTGDVTPLDDFEAKSARGLAIEELLRQSMLSPERFEDFLDLLRQQSRSHEETRVVDLLDQVVAELHQKFLLTPAGRIWGSHIWPKANPWLGLPDPKSLVPDLKNQLAAEHPDFNEKQQTKWTLFFDEIERLRPGGKWTDDLEYILKKVIDREQENDPDGPKVISIFKKVEFSESLWKKLVQLTRSLVAFEIQACITRSEALYELMQRFEHLYERRIRSGGQLTFLDVTGLLAKAAGASWGAERTSLIDRTSIDFRIDGQFDHWLIDEFQDTSRLQWAALKNLVDEVIQDPSGERSFFYVGDIKQAIYGWRGGDPKLFEDIFKHYNSGAETRLEEGTGLHRSYRSRPEILQTVNAVFGALPEFQKAMELPLESVNRWQKGWSEHSSAKPEAAGYVHCCETENVFEEMVKRIQEIDPITRGLSCAVLLQKNETILEVVEALRQAGIPASEETSMRPCVDNLAGAALRAAFQLLAHPGDSLAEAHLKMTPFGVLLEEGVPLFIAKWRTAILREGFAKVVRSWNALAMPECGIFVRGRLDAWVNAAAAFDESRESGLDAFLRYIEEYRMRENESADSVRVMTFHHSKGLGFDCVILPELGGKKLTEVRPKPVYLHANGDGEIEWGLDLPTLKIREMDEVLKAATHDSQADAAYENLCKFYVAMTRAKKAMYLIHTDKKSDSLNFIKLLRLTLKELPYELGNANWFEEFEALSPDPIPEPISIPKPISTAVNSTPHLRPSSSKTSLRAADWLSEKRKQALEHGEEVHRQIALSDDELPFPKDAPVRKLFGIAGETVWREKAFQVRIDQKSVSGIFDRVIVAKDHATILEFKTEHGSDAELLAKHRNQLITYRDALAVLTRLETDAIRVFLVPVSTGRLLELSEK